MTDQADRPPRFSRDITFYASRGFVESLNASQREVFLSLFEGQEMAFAIETSLEQARFEFGANETPNPDAPVLAALSYALPRMSTAGWTVATEIERMWPTLSDMTRKLVREKINKAIEAGRSGASCDTAHWRRVANLPLNEAERIERTSF
ncbi:hypothetical protein OIU34_20720 [Pararhizobium sp. BT-229]|uniref:hypothetical protein n=1 Tax=Pararhizobium sp. BT-229 TaxID=2986923 RepID=UPI0021F78C21|nr:hypothetical protein [Pararhizobium sp. BT-229]MCV9964314.1 hypothetical protein [Pararhizobium sp. BT-229]